MGLRLWPADERAASPTTTAIRIPAGIEDAALRAAVRAHYGVVFSAGRGETLGKLLRIGHMGPTAQPIYAIVAVAALGGALQELRRAHRCGRGSRRGPRGDQCGRLRRRPETLIGACRDTHA
jgi:pyridoxamine--pyruvate transaminase